jgi:alpha-beta hydrolase superfamily lysophospholipase
MTTGHAIILFGRSRGGLVTTGSVAADPHGIARVALSAAVPAPRVADPVWPAMICLEPCRFNVLRRSVGIARDVFTDSLNRLRCPPSDSTTGPTRTPGGARNRGTANPSAR